MNQGKSEVVKQKMARVNIDILGISELRWTGMGEFNSDDHYIYYCGQESLNRQWVMKILNILSCVSFVSCLAQILCLTCKFSNCWHKFVHVHVHAYSVMSDSLRTH